MVLHHVKVVSTISGDKAVNPNKTYNELKLAIQTIEQHVGGFTANNLLALVLHLNAHHAYQEIANALNSRIAIDKRVWVTSKDVLELVSRHCSPQNDIPSSALLSYSVRPARPPAHKDASAY